MKRKYLVLPLLGVVLLSGCTANKEMLAAQKQEIASLQTEVARLKLLSEAKDVDLEALMGKLDDIKNVEVHDNRVVLPNAIMFRSGGVGVTDQGKVILDEIWDILVTVPNREITIEGHTDNIPIAKKDVGTYKTNWELSAVRALSVLHYVSKHTNANPARLGAVGYGEYRPVASNDTEEGRALNRRVEIVIGRQLK